MRPVVQATRRCRRTVTQSAGQALREGVSEAHRARTARIHLAKWQSTAPKHEAAVPSEDSAPGAISELLDAAP